MGNICTRGGRRPTKPFPASPESTEKNSDTLNSEFVDANDFISKMKEYHLNRIRKELEKDPHAFILDNLLMCIQFFDNFDTSVDLANEYRRNAEREMTELLAKDPLEGMILGDRRIKLLSGMSYVLAQNFIYRGKNHPEEEEGIDSYYGGSGLKDTFMTEGILPLDFLMSWDNFELYDPSELDDLKDYSDAKGASPSARLCVEQPDKRTEYPKGYIRLRCIDEPISHRRQMEIPHHPSSESGYEHIHEPAIYSEVVPEAHSESDGAEPHSGSTSEDEDMLKTLQILKSLPSTKMAQLTFDQPNISMPSTSKAARQVLPGSPLTKPNLTKLNMSPLAIDKNESYPSLVVHAATPPVHDGMLPMQSYENGLLYPHTKSGRILNQFSKSTPNLPTSERNSPGKDVTSSGYDTTSTRSRSSSMQSGASEMLRDQWKKKNLKQLWEFVKKSRKDQIPAGSRYDPIPPDCYSEVKYELQYDAPLETEDGNDEVDEDSDNDEEDSTDDEFDFSTGTLQSNKKRRNTEDDYQMRFYVNSLQFSSNACSEFHCIGPNLSIPSSSLSNGVVLGTTIRCPIAFTYPRKTEDEDVGSYHVTYSFTPALHSKSWPSPLYFHFNQQIFNHKYHGKMWPSREQMEQIEHFGCNAIPLGYRSLGFFNAEQILEWELNFHECERNLLDSFQSAHWRAYIFASILFRAFIAPLGPQGVGLEHIRNILYYMCYEEFYGFNDEQPGLHLTKLLDNLFNCLSKRHMPSFFVRSRNLLQSVPPHNLQFVQGHLKQVRENVIVYCIYAFRNLKNIREPPTYSMPSFNRLYEILTAQDGELLYFANPLLQMQKDREDEERRQNELQRARSSKKKKQKPKNLLDQQDEIDKSFFASQREIHGAGSKRVDKVQRELRRKHRQHEKKLEEDRKRDRETRKLKRDPEHRLPDAEKRQSIDLKKEPVIPPHFSKFRMLLVIQFFIKHFLDMAKKATRLENYSQATMYVLQVENLSEIAQEEQCKNVSPVFTDEDFESYREETLRLRGIIGSDMEQYILARISFPKTSPYSLSTPARSLTDLTSDPAGGFPSFTNNWDLRKLPTPPPSENEIRPTGKKLEKPNIASSLQSFDSFSNTRAPSVTPTPTPLSPMLPPADRVKPRRQESIKFVSAVLSQDSQPPATPPRSRSQSRAPSRQSTVDLALDREDDEEDESTDL